MDGMDAGVMDTPEVESPEVDTEQPELGNAEGGERPEVETPEQAESKDNPFTTQFSRDYRKYLNDLKTTNPEAAKYIQQAKNDYGRLFALQQVEPKGIDGIREKYALLDSLTHGEVKGSEALTAMQESIREAEEVDGYILNGDPKAFESMGKEFDAGLAKLAPAYMERLQQASPEAFQSAVMPHMLGMLAKSEMIAGFNGAVDELRWRLGDKQLNQMNEQEVRQIAAKAIQTIQGVSNGFNTMADKVEAAKTVPTNEADPRKSEFEQQRTQFEQERQAHHWNTKIEPLVAGHHDKMFDQHFKSYQARLKLNDKGIGTVKAAFRQGVIDAARKDQDYQRQYKAFKNQKNPDPALVSNYVNNWMAGKAKSLVDGVVGERYGSFLAGKPKAVPIAAKPAARGPAEPNVEIRTVKPPMNEIDHKNTPLDWTAASYPGGKKYRLYSGRVVQVRSTV